MSEFKGSKGKWEIRNKNNSSFSIEVIDKSFAEVYVPFDADDIYESQANAELIAEAGNIRQQIQFSLTELKRQRDELLSELKIAVKALEAVYSFGATKPIIERWQKVIESATEIK